MLTTKRIKTTAYMKIFQQKSSLITVTTGMNIYPLYSLYIFISLQTSERRH